VVIHACELTIYSNSFFSDIKQIVEWYKLFHIRLVPWFFPPRAAVMLASWGWNKLGAQPWEHRIKGLQSVLTGTGLYHNLIPLHGDCPAMCSWSASTRSICWLLFIVCRTCICTLFFFLAAAQLADLVVVVTQIQTDQLLLPTMVNQLQGWQWRAWKLMYCSLEWNRAKQLGSSNIKWKQSGVKVNPSVPNSYSLISTALTP